jgi:tRNA pseudouridine38-40 synthase
VPNIRLLIEYNGSKFHGWQHQPGLRTVQKELHGALETVLREKIHHVQASGRTDEGVHARRQVVNFKCEKTPDLVILRRSISSILRNDLAVHSAEIAPDNFHSLRDACGKTYRYTVYHHDVPPVLDSGRVWLVNRQLDPQIMVEAAAAMVGTHDFKSFQGAKCGSPSSIKSIYESRIEFKAPYIIYTVTGSGFLKHMVRNIVGSLLLVGDGRKPLDFIEEVLRKKDRTQAGPTAPPHGLYFYHVAY